VRIRLSALLLLAALLAAAAGCQKLTYEKTIHLDPGEVYEIEFSAPSYQQKVTVTIDPKTSGVSAYLLKSSDKAAVKGVLNKVKGGEPPASALLASRVSSGGPEKYTFEATAPAKTEYMLLLKSSKSTDVTVKLVGR
jgi:hypothetical protein